MLDLNDLVLFAKVASLGSISAASNALDRPKSSISRRMDQLERSLGTKLLERSSRGLTLTDAGHVLLEHCETVIRDTEEAVAAISYHGSAPRGRLRVSAPFAFGQRFLAPLVPSFLDAYPELTLSLELDNHRIDIHRDGFDVAIRVGVLEDSSLIARRLGSSPLRLYAAPSYLEKAGEPDTPEALEDHDLIDIRTLDGERNWTLEKASGQQVTLLVSPRFCANDPTALCAATVGGSGVALLPAFLGDDETARGRLRHILPDWSLPGSDFHAIFSSRRTPLKVRVFVDFLVRELSRREPWNQNG